MPRILVSRFFSILLFATLIAISPQTTARAQSNGATTGSIIGSVKDEQGAVIVNATIKAVQVETNLERTIQTGEDGGYLIVQLPPGNYQLTAQCEGYSSRVVNLELNLGITALFNFTLPPGITSEVIEVKANNVLDESR